MTLDLDDKALAGVLNQVYRKVLYDFCQRCQKPGSSGLASFHEGDVQDAVDKIMEGLKRYER